MATSALTLSLIIDEMLKAKPANRDAAIELLAAKGYLPKKLSEKPKVKKTSIFASKTAEDFAEANGIEIPEGFTGTANNDKISVKDLKKLAEPPKKKINASPTAQSFCRDNGLDITKVKGTGADGKVLLKDVKDLKPAAAAGSSSDGDDKLKISSSAAKLMKQYEIDEEDIVDVEGTGTNGTVVAKDLKELIDLIKAEKSDESSDEEDDA